MMRGTLFGLINSVIAYGVLVSAGGHSAIAARGQTNCTAETTAVTTTVSSGDSLVFNWDPACCVAMVLVEYELSGGDRWGIHTPPERWRSADGGNTIVPPLVY